MKKRTILFIALIQVLILIGHVQKNSTYTKFSYKKQHNEKKLKDLLIKKHKLIQEIEKHKLKSNIKKQAQKLGMETIKLSQIKRI